MIPVIINCEEISSESDSHSAPIAFTEIAGIPLFAHTLAHLRTQGLHEQVYIYAKKAFDVQQKALLKAYGVLEPNDESASSLSSSLLHWGIEGPYLVIPAYIWTDAALRTLAADCLIRQPGEWVLALHTTPSLAGAVYAYEMKSRQIGAMASSENMHQGVFSGIYLGWMSSSPEHETASDDKKGFFAAQEKAGKLFARPFPDSTFLDIRDTIDLAKAEILLHPENN